MCMLCVIPPGCMPSREKLENSALNNPHGFGFAIVVPDEDRIIVERTMDADESINRFLKVRAEYMEGYAMWHARFATHGSKNVANCHPFKVGKDKRTYLAHNGIIDIEIAKADDRSDTRVYAEDLLPAIGGVKSLDNEHVFAMMEDYLSGSKVCILTVDPDAKHQCYVLNESLGNTDVDGVWWSNNSCFLQTYTSTAASKGGIYAPYGYYKGDFDMWKDPDSEEEYVWTCPDPKCAATLTNDEVDMYDFACYLCGACIDCQSTYQDCMCFKPVFKEKKETKNKNGAWALDY